MPPLSPQELFAGIEAFWSGRKEVMKRNLEALRQDDSGLAEKLEKEMTSILCLEPRNVRSLIETQVEIVKDGNPNIETPESGTSTQLVL